MIFAMHIRVLVLSVFFSCGLANCASAPIVIDEKVEQEERIIKNGLFLQKIFDDIEGFRDISKQDILHALDIALNHGYDGAIEDLHGYCYDNKIKIPKAFKKKLDDYYAEEE